VYVGHDGRTGESVQRLLAQEQERGLDSLAGYAAFPRKVQETKTKLLRFLLDAREQGETVAAYGAAAKGNTLLNYCGIRSDLVDFVVDVNPLKQGRYLPGTRIPIRHPDEIAKARPDYLLILPWNLREEVIQQNAFARTWGCRFVTPIPEVQVFD
jgi:hypothetical protein